MFFFSVLLKSRKNVTFEGSLFNYEGNVIYIYEGTFAYNIYMYGYVTNNKCLTYDIIRRYDDIIYILLDSIFTKKSLLDDYFRFELT